ncbi:hypothetical protein [Fischerella sp. JS2]|uniref:hypothetical protein n=1 Tax=Fischerella sp. JS2 TaxID=2597771 RepID=UPI0028E31993|nr:hypothetical protein [Fischerella sp. JS2]
MLKSRFLAVTTLIATVGVSLSLLYAGMAQADDLDDVYDQCVEAYQSGQLDNQDLEYCYRVAQIKQQRDTRNAQYYIWQRGLQTQQDILDMGANPIIIQPTDFGIGN